MHNHSGSQVLTPDPLNARPSVRTWIWDRGKPGAIPGARILRGKWAIFIPAHSLRHVADRLHDIADEYDKHTQGVAHDYKRST